MMTDPIFFYPRLIVKPRQTFRQIAENPPGTVALVGFLIATVIGAIAEAPKRAGLFQHLSAYWPLLSSATGQVAASAGLNILLSPIQALFLHGITRLLGGKGRWEVLWTAIMFIGTMATLFDLLPIAFIGVAIAFWGAAMTVLALMSVYGVGWAKAIAVLGFEFGLFFMIALRFIGFIKGRT